MTPLQVPAQAASWWDVWGTTMLPRVGALCGAACAFGLGAAGGAAAQTTDNQTQLKAWPAYAYDKQTYARARVFVTYGDAEATMKLTGDCPSKGIIDKNTDFGKLIERLATADRTLTVGFTATPPGYAAAELTPAEISIEDKFWGPSKCNIRMEKMEYVSPLFDTVTYSALGFRIAPSARVRNKPTQDLVKASSDFAGLLAGLAKAPAPVVTKIKGAVTNTLEGAGDNQVANLAVTLSVNPTLGSVTNPKWEADTGLGGQKKTLRIEARLENVASLFALEEPKLRPDLFKDQSADGILNTPLLRDASNTPTTVRDVVQDALKGSNDLQTFTAATSAATAQPACANISMRLGTLGMTETDQALVLWAMARTHANLGGKTEADKNLEQTACLKAKKDKLSAVGVSLLETPPPPPPKGAHPTTTQMRSAVELDSAYAHFFVTPNGAEWLEHARQLFTDKPTVIDADKRIFKATPPDLSTDTFRYFTNEGAGPLLTKVGCYAYLPSDGPDVASQFWAIGVTPQDTEVAIRGAFAPSTSDSFEINRLEISSQLADADRAKIQAARKSAPCAKDWHPKLLSAQ
ncbi:hypothetical protein [Phenylobacterium zucineum]|uniref:hypothetical protein n=1 Tax=Phenylobacterium zucineum TaxID=284016 RepID=UPI0011D12DF7|nr:hypothetical protein [Phenylobacterium zucineum]